MTYPQALWSLYGIICRFSIYELSIIEYVIPVLNGNPEIKTVCLDSRFRENDKQNIPALTGIMRVSTIEQ